MLEIFYPCKQIDSVYQISFSTLSEQGTRGVIFDIDNTLVPHDLEADDKIIDLVRQIKSLGIKIYLLSNNNQQRVSKFAGVLDVPYTHKAGKPSTRNYQKAMAVMGTDQSNTVFVGDQLFTDILGANRTGIFSILVKPIHPSEEIQIVLKRYLEAVVLFFYKRHGTNRKAQERKE